jgi:peroxiredoxin
MVALAEGSKSPLFNLKATDGVTFSLADALKQNSLVVVAFFKVSCPVCQLAFPYLERLHQSYPSVPIWGISQDDSDATDAFARMFGVTFPMLLDIGLSSTVDFGLTNVPTVFVISQNQTITQTTVGFSKADLEKLNSTLADKSKQNEVPLFTAADEVPALKPG